MVKGEGWGRREGRREPDRSHPQLQPLAGKEIVPEAAAARDGAPEGGRPVAGGWVPEPAGPRPRWWARLREQGAWLGLLGRGAGAPPALGPL